MAYPSNKESKKQIIGEYMEKNTVISPYFENGIFAGVRVTSVDEDFLMVPKAIAENHIER